MSDLTPIRVRGKRRKPNHEAQPSSATAGTGARPRTKTGGRPLMSLREKQLSAQARLKRRQGLVETSIAAYISSHGNANAYSQFQTRKAHNLSNLECLPVELIEKIFLYSLNVNLPRCSPSLKAALSRERVYRVLILLAFWRDPLSGQEQGQGNGTGKGNEAIARILRPLDYVPLDEEERRVLQSTVLRCRWCTFPRVLGQLPDLMRLAIQRYWTDAGIHMDWEQQENLSRFLAREEDAAQNQETTRSFHGTGTGQETNHYTLSITPLLSITITNLETEHQTTHPLLSLREFPNKLLRGDPNHFAFLETLRVAGGFNREEQQCMLEANKNVSLSRLVLHEGIHNALVRDNSQALICLLKIDEYFARCEIAATTTATENTSSGIPYTIPSEHFRTAIRSHSSTQTQSSLFHHLLRANAESVPPDDAEITQWAMDRGDDVFGHWLLDLMLRLPRQVEAARANPRDEGLFYMGRGNGNVEMGRKYLSEVLGVEELGGWMGETGVDFGELWFGDSAGRVKEE